MCACPFTRNLCACLLTRPCVRNGKRTGAQFPLTGEQSSTRIIYFDSFLKWYKKRHGGIRNHLRKSPDTIMFRSQPFLTGHSGNKQEKWCKSSINFVHLCSCIQTISIPPGEPPSGPDDQVDSRINQVECPQKELHHKQKLKDFNNFFCGLNDP